MLKIAVAAILIAAGAPVAAQTATSPQVSAPDNGAPKPAKPKREKKICRSVKSVTSRIPDSVCHTQSEWAELDAHESSMPSQGSGFAGH